MKRQRWFLLGWWTVFWFLASPRLQAQLAITEVMSSGSTNKGPAQVGQNSDYWELTNFGPNTIDLTGYKFDDSDNNLAAADSLPFDGVKIGSGESIVFIQDNFNTNDVAFRAWWGTNLSATVKLRFYSGNGLSSGGDGIRLWSPTAQDAADVVDSVDFAEAVRGSSFTYDPQTGAFGVVSTNGAGGAFTAETADDVGSPGKTTGPTPITFDQQPADTVVNPGDLASFSVHTRGRPRGAVQWYFRGAALDGATNAVLQIADAQAADAGEYYAWIGNGVTSVRSASAFLILQSEVSAPAFTQIPSDLELYVGQGATFGATATGVPQPSYRWQKDGQDLDGAAASVLTLSGVAEADSGTYAVIAGNLVGAVTNLIHVTVTPKPELVITEVMSSPATNGVTHADWWELTNLGSFPVHLRGYRFDDNSESLASAFIVTNDIVIAAAESVVLVEGMTASEFKDWWGLENLLPNLQILTYRGNGLSSAGDAVNLWNAAASEESDKVASAVFSTATSGVSFGYHTDTSEFGGLSVAEADGAFLAASGADTGSPGYTRNSQRVFLPRVRSLQVLSGSVRMVWSSRAGATYVVQSKAHLEDAVWGVVWTGVATEGTTTVDQPLSAAQQFYRVAQQP